MNEEDGGTKIETEMKIRLCIPTETKIETEMKMGWAFDEEGV